MDDAEAMASFSEPVRHWFADAFGAPTAVQGEAWKAIVRDSADGLGQDAGGVPVGDRRAHGREGSGR